ncbi:MAG: hypothetical protein KF830_03565 [Planctomycetes bacterium]|nr:hypothetical protein [Planctomycetota bacterium]
MYFAVAYAVAAASAPAGCQQTVGETARQMLGGRIASGVFVSAERKPDGESTLHVRDREQHWSIDLPYSTITAAASLASDVLVAGILPDQTSEYRRLTQESGNWVTVAIGSPPRRSHVIKMAGRDDRLALLLADGTIVAASIATSGSSGLPPVHLPNEPEFVLVGTVPNGLQRTIRLASLELTSIDCIEVYDHPSSRHAFVRAPSGHWTGSAILPVSGPTLRITEPARVGSEVRYVATVIGPLVLEEEGTNTTWPIADTTPPSGQGVIPAELTSQLRIDHRYRLKAHEVAGPWFRPAAIVEHAWGVNGVELQEVDTFEGGVRIERGSVIVDTVVHFSPVCDRASVHKVAFVATSSEPAPPLAVRGGRTWLVPDRALMAAKDLTPPRRTYPLTVSLPLPDDATCVGRWLHVQMAVLGTDGSLLGATGVRSVRILPNRGDWPVERQQTARSAAEAYWAANGVADPDQFWRSIVGN